MEKEDLGAWLGLAIGGGSGGGGAVSHGHEDERRSDPVRFDALFSLCGKQVRDRDEQATRKTGGIGATQRMKVGDDDDGRSSSGRPCPSDGSSDGGRRKKLRLTKEQCTLLEDSFRAHNILSHVCNYVIWKLFRDIT
jgi:hypothetical protein